MAPEKEDAGTAAREFASAFLESVGKPDPAGDPLVAVAFALGWQMAELYHPSSWPATEPAPGEDLPGMSELSGRQHASMGLAQVDVASSRLKDAMTEHGLTVPSTAAAEKVLEDKGTDVEFREQVFDLHVTLLTTLTAASYKLGKAYGLGRALADTTRQPTDIRSLKTELDEHRIANLKAWIDDLTSLLPPHAGHSVAESLIRWRDWAKTAIESPGKEDPKVIRLLRRQGERWRALLSGEKQATDGLELDDYAGAGVEMLERLGSLTRSFLARFWVAAGVAAALFAGSIVFILTDPNGAHVAGGIGGLLASAGVTWKGVGASLGKTAATLERPVWEASLDVQITDAITRLPGDKRTQSYTPPLVTGEAKPVEAD
jgi:hypothetical protein